MEIIDIIESLHNIRDSLYMQLEKLVGADKYATYPLYRIINDMLYDIEQNLQYFPRHIRRKNND